MRFVKSCSLAWASSSARSPTRRSSSHSTLPAGPRLPVKLGENPGDCRRAALSIGFRPGKTAFLWRSLAFLQLDLFRQGCSATSTGPKTSCSLLSSRNCDEPVERGGASSSLRGGAMGKPRTRKMPTLRGLLLLLAVEDRSERCGAHATAKPKDR